MHRHEMQQSNIYLNMYIIEYYSFWKNWVLHIVFGCYCLDAPLLDNLQEFREDFMQFGEQGK
jgi:hypothetical protein